MAGSDTICNSPSLLLTYIIIFEPLQMVLEPSYRTVRDTVGVGLDLLYSRCWELLGVSLTLTNLGNDHEFISKEYISIGMRPFWEAQSKVMRVYARQ